MLKNGSRETFMKTIDNIGEIGRSERYCAGLSFCIWFGFRYFCWFLRRLFEHVTAKRGFKLCFYQKTEVANRDFLVPVTAGVPVWCGEVCCEVVSGDDEPMCPGSVAGFDPGLCACTCWETSEGAAASGWVCLRWLNGLKVENLKNI